jgi:hypothetical protein
MVATERMACRPFGQQGRQLLPDGLDEVWWESGHGDPTSSGSVENFPDDGASVPVSHSDALPIGGSSDTRTARNHFLRAAWRARSEAASSRLTSSRNP